ncbi:MAG: hypothetical protein LBT45_00860 [Rickettsiales bacterium]|nr:hypothetical protein [Rickettsiales bacterium]
MKNVLAVFLAVVSSAVFADDTARSSRVVSVGPSPLAGEVQKISRAAAAKAAAGKNEQSAAGRPSRMAVQANKEQSRASAEAEEAESAAAQAATSRDASAAGAKTISRAAVSRGRSGAPAATATRSAAAQSQSGRGASTRGGGGSRPSFVEVDGRAVTGRAQAAAGQNIDDEVSRKLSRRSRAAVDTMFEGTAESAEAPSAASELADCSASYFDCMNQFCNVLDANQKQCSCSGRLSQYKKVEDSLTEANNELNNVAQQIRYVGLAADEIRSIMKETEAEKVMSTTEDRTQSRSMLEEIEKLIKSPTADYSSGGSSSLDFSLDFSGEGDDFDLSSLFGDNESFANMRGTELYAAAKKKCKPILTRCAAKKADQSIISGQYDIEIDKACIQYEAGLKKATAGVKTNIRSATQMLQKARLTVLGEQNAYDAKGCVSALDSCMRDEMVCGDKYYKCVDPSKRAIDENGNVIPGGDLVALKEYASTYDARCLARLLDSSVSEPASCDVATAANETNGKEIVDYLKSKIGVMDNNGRVVSGFCRPVLDKCRRYTYSDGQYVDNNTVIKSYMERTMSQIIAAQSGVIAEYAKTCLTDVSTCYNGQITSANSYGIGTSLSPSIVRPILMGACRSVALSCAYVVFSTAGARDSVTEQNALIDRLSNMFYQTLMCPLNSTWSDTLQDSDGVVPAEKSKYINSNCKCNSGYYVSVGTCAQIPASAPACPANSGYAGSSNTPSANGTENGYVSETCKCYEGYYVFGNVCNTCPSNSVSVINTCTGTCAADGTCPSTGTGECYNVANNGNDGAKGIISPYCQCQKTGKITGTPKVCPIADS